MIVWGGLDAADSSSTGGRYNAGDRQLVRRQHRRRRAERALQPHGGVDGNRDDRLGRLERPQRLAGSQLLEYRRPLHAGAPTVGSRPTGAERAHAAQHCTRRSGPATEMIVWGGGRLAVWLQHRRALRARYRHAGCRPPSAPTSRALVRSHGGLDGHRDDRLGRRPAPASRTPAAGTIPGLNSLDWPPASAPTCPSPATSTRAVWTGTEMIVWGGSDGLGNFHDSGGSLHSDTRTAGLATSTFSAPSARYFHTAVWTGNEMIVWGGGNPLPLSTGGRYDPDTDTWTPVSTAAGAPSARLGHTAVWTGSEMIVWGGSDTTNFQDGGRYDPIANTWAPTSTGANVPAARYFHSAVWTGNEMIVWGGDESGEFVSTGGRYFPGSDTWETTSTTAAPAGRYFHTAVWTDDQMLVWGGESRVELNTGGLYCAAPPAASSRSLHVGSSTPARRVTARPFLRDRPRSSSSRETARFRWVPRR